MAKARVPKHLGKAGAAFWRELTTEYGIADSGGVALATRAAECVDHIAEAQAAIAGAGRIVKNQYGMPVLHPAVKLEKEGRDGFYKAIGMLNLDLEPLRDGRGRPPGSFLPESRRTQK